MVKMNRTPAAMQIRQFVSKIEKLEEEKKEVTEYLSDVYKEAKSLGFDVKVLKLAIKRRKTDQQELFETEEILKLYESALAGFDIDEEYTDKRLPPEGKELVSDNDTKVTISAGGKKIETTVGKMAKVADIMDKKARNS